MLLKPQQLGPHLKSASAPVYFLHGGEPLLIEDSANLLRETFKRNGFSERIVFTQETGFDWQHFANEFDSLSLFSKYKLIELRLPTGKPGTKGAQILSQVASNTADATALLILSGKLESAVKNAQWVKQVAKAGVIVEHFPVSAPQLPGWISARAKQYQLLIDSKAARLLAYYLEGNLLAIDQELKKFALLGSHTSITAEMVHRSVQDSARFSIYGLIDAAVAGQLDRALRMLVRLKAEGMEPVLINWALAREVRLLLTMSGDLEQGKSLPATLRQHKVWRNRSGLVESALSRLSHQQWRHIHRQVAGMDRRIKGRGTGTFSTDIWLEYERIIASLCEVNSTC